MMGPDCGTAIINGTALCFGNSVRRGSIGIIGASGTGSQELSVRIHEFGAGVSHHWYWWSRFKRENWRYHDD